MKTPEYLVKAPIDSPNRSGFSMPFENHLTGECGTLYPALMKEMIPNETVSLDVMHDIELPPMISNFRGRVDMIYEAFFVPYSLLWGGWEQFAMHPTHNPVYPEDTPVDWKPTSIPRLRFLPDSGIGTLSLGNYLGFRGPSFFVANYDTNILPWLCYHRVYDDWYRNTLVQTKIFGPPRYASSSYDHLVSNLPYLTMVDASVGNSSLVNTSTLVASYGECTFFDGVQITELRQRNWNLDYFTAATPQPQAGSATNIEFSVDSNGDGSLSIAALRTGNAIQQWKERNNIVGYDYYSQMHAQHGIYPRMRKLDKCIYLGRVVDPVYNRSIFQTTATTGSDGSVNPFATTSGEGIGAKFGASQANGRGNLFTNFTTFDYGYIVVMASMRPHAYYSTGIDPKTKTQFIGDIAFPLLSGVGDQAIYGDELSLGSSNVFGWTDRYAQHKCYIDEVHGEFSANGVLAPFVLQRDIGAFPVIGSDFLEIPKNFMEQVRQVDKSVVQSDWFGTIYFNFNKISTLPQYSVPTLADIKHSHTEFVRKGGQKL